MIHVRDDDFIALAESLSNRQTYQANKRRGVHTKRDFARIARVQEIGDTFASVCNRRVHLLAFRVTAAPLNVAFEQMVVDGVKNDLRHLRSGSVVEKREVRGTMQRGKEGANCLDGKV